MELYEAIRARQSMRSFKPDPVPAQALQRILEAFQAAPSWANVQPWELILVHDPDTKRKLQETLPPGNPAAKALTEAPIVICVVGIAGRSGFYKGRAATKRGDFMLFDLGIATEHLALAAAAEGLGTVHVALFDMAKADAVLGLSGERGVVEMLPLGFPTQTPHRTPRKELKDFVFRDRWGRGFFPA